jgi:hypothetical protein
MEHHSCSSTYALSTSVQTFDRGGLGINFIRDGCTTSVWFMAPYTDGRWYRVLGVYIKERAGITPTMVNKFYIDTSNQTAIIPSDADISRNFIR